MIDKISSEINLPNGTRLILFDTLGTDIRENIYKNSNIILINQQNNIVWRIHSNDENDGGPFTSIYKKNGSLYAYRWNGIEYTISMTDGLAIPNSLLK